MSRYLSWRPCGRSSRRRSTGRPGDGRGAPNGCACRVRCRTPGARRRTPRWKSSWTSASAATFPGFQCEGIAWRPDGTIIKAISPRNQYIPLKLLGSGMAVDFYVEAAANPDLSQGWTFAATPYGDKATAGQRTEVPARQDRHRRTQPDGLGAAAGRLDPQRPDARTADGAAPPPRNPPRAGTHAGRHGPGRRPRHGGRGP